MDDGPFDPDRELPSIRASDTERADTVMILQESYAEGRLTLAEFDERTEQAYGARFQAELTKLTRDLSPAHGVHELRHPSEHDASLNRNVSPSRRVSGGSGPSTSLAIMGGCQRTGPWTVTEGHTTVAVMGGVSLDLRQADLQSHETTIRAFAFMGGIEIVVPDDIHLSVDGVGLLGYFGEKSVDDDDGRPVRLPPPDAPRIRVTGLAAWAAIEVHRVPRD